MGPALDPGQRGPALGLHFRGLCSGPSPAAPFSTEQEVRRIKKGCKIKRDRNEKGPIENLGMKECNWRLDTTLERFNELEGRTEEISQNAIERVF